MPDFWPASGFQHLEQDSRGWLVPTPGYWRLFLARPELAPVDESCPAERMLHASLLVSPARVVADAELARLADADARANYRLFLGFRDAVQAAGTLETWYTGLFRQPAVTLPPLFIDLVAQAITRHLLDGTEDAYQVRAAELLFRTQRITVQDGQVLACLTHHWLHRGAGGLGAVGRLLALYGAAVALRRPPLPARPRRAAVRRPGRAGFLLDLTHEVTQDLSHGLVFHMTRARSGLKALAQVLERWVRHFLGVDVTILPVQKIDDPAWRWHLGLDTEASALLNDLYEERPVEPGRMQRLVSLFRLEFANPLDMRADVAGKPVYLGLAMNAEGVLKLKPQNLLLNLPLATPT